MGRRFRHPLMTGHFSPQNFRSDDEQMEEIANVESSVWAEILTYGAISGEQTVFGWYFAHAIFEWDGCCSPDMPKAGQYNFKNWRKPYATAR